MPVNYEKLKEWSFSPVVQSVRKRDVQFYALSVGLGRDPSDEKELRFVYEHGLVVLPTMPAVIAQPGFWVDEPSQGIDLLSIFHGEQKVTLHRRSEEHTSELQSLMRISYAVFCLKKKKTQQKTKQPISKTKATL